MADLAALKGVVVPIITPLTPDEQVDVPSLRRLTAWLLDRGVHGFWVNGSSGEFFALDAEQRAIACRTVVETVAGRVPVIATVSDCGTALTIRHGQAAREAGADIISAIAPYYFPLGQDEILAHYRRLREAVDLPLMVYNYPQMVKVRPELPTVLQLAEEGTVIGIKDSQNQLDWFRKLLIGARQRGLEFYGFVGTRSLMDAAIAVGAAGVIPNVANIAPGWCVRCYNAAMVGDYAAARRAQEVALQYDDLARVANGGTPVSASQAVVKAVLSLWGVIDYPTVPAPQRSLTSAEMEKLKELLARLPRDAEAAT